MTWKDRIAARLWSVQSDAERAHAHSLSNRTGIERSDRCGCFYCLAVFSPSEIDEWVEDARSDTALCPRCGIDSVLGDAAVPLSGRLLREMRRMWF
jgi:hypothetical protein